MKLYSMISVIMLLFVPGLVAQTMGSAVPQFFDVKYDTTADPFVQLEKAKTESVTSGRRILLDVGGEWCSWCHRLDDFFRKNADVTDVVKKNFVVLKVNFSLANKNEKFLSQFPEISGYPHIFVLDATGKLLHSQDTGLLEEGKGYSKDKMIAFIKQWGNEKAVGSRQ